MATSNTPQTYTADRPENSTTSVDANDIAGPAVFLASDLSVYVTGHIIMADGGCRTV